MKKWVFKLLFSLGFIILSLPGIIMKYPWHDEIYTLELASKSPPKIIRALRWDSGPPLYYLLASGWSRIFGHEIRYLRYFNVLIILLGFWLFYPLSSPWTWFLFSHPLIFYFVGESRAYSLLFFFIGGALWAYRKNHGLWSFLFFGASLYTHNLAFLFIPLWLIIFPKKWKRTLGTLLVYLPWLPILLTQPASSMTWTSPLWQSLHPGIAFLLPFSHLGSSNLPGHMALYPWSWIGAFITLGFFIWGCLRDRKILVLLMPYGIFILYGLLKSALYFPGRWEMVFLPWWVFLMEKPLPLMRYLYPVFLALSLLTLTHWWVTLPEPTYEEVIAKKVLSLPQVSQVIVPASLYLELNYAIRKKDPQVRVYPFPREVLHHPGWFDPMKISPQAWKKEWDYLMATLKYGGYVIWDTHLPFPSALQKQTKTLWSYQGLVGLKVMKGVVN